VAVKKVADDLVAAGVELGDEATEGLGLVAKTLNGDDLTKFMNKLGSTCSVGDINSSTKLAVPVGIGSVCNPELVKKILTSYKRFTPDMSEGSSKIAAAIGSESWGELMIRYANDPDTLLDANSSPNRIFGKLGKNTNEEALRIAATNGPEGINALSYWHLPLLQDPSLSKQLAKRSGRDAETIEIMSKWVVGAMPSEGDLIKIGMNSRDGYGNFFGLGVLGGTPNYATGYVKYARDNVGEFYFTHPEVGTYVKKIFSDSDTQNAIFWKINKEALDEAIVNQVPFKYSFLKYTDTDIVAKEIEAIKAIETAVKTNTSWEGPVKAILGEDSPFRMREVYELLSRGYTVNYGDYFSSKVILFER
jgi:hypothetical protein